MGRGTWDAAQAPSPKPEVPGMSFYKAAFAYSAATHGGGPFKLHLPGMRKGQVWLNGRNIGRYWQEVGPQEAYKLPAAWLRPENELLIFDEEGAPPRDVWIGADALGADQTVHVLLRNEGAS